ncbi:MAG: amino acid adenylation domain-containing protein [Herpetosiphonaceae bacterium]|nr:amino acid adenylation domain-containing protein [Herpetosiphonaceae bacterium]
MSQRFSDLVHLLHWRANEQPDQRAYTFLLDGEIVEATITYRELDRRARLIGGWLQAAGATGERVLLLYPPGLDYITAFFGVLYAGAVAVPAYPPQSARLDRALPLRLRTITADAKPLIALTIAAVLPIGEALAAQDPTFAALRWIATDVLDEADGTEWQMPTIKPETLAFLQYTSGSTAAPKGVMLTHGNLMHNLQQIQRRFEDDTTSRGLIWLPPYHDMGLIGGILQPLHTGFPVTLMAPISFLQRPLRWLEAVTRYHATTSGGPNFAYELCARKVTPEQLAMLDLSSWRVAFTGAEPIRAATLEQFAAAFAPCGFRMEAFYPCYGLAEATLIVSGGKRTRPPVIEAFDGAALEQNRVVAVEGTEPGTRTFVGCGQIIADQQLLIADPQTHLRCQTGEIGEIWVAGPSVAQGYWQQPATSAETFGAYLRDGERGPFLRTGDLGFVHNDELFVASRIKDLIIIRGRNHYPQDIELTVERCHPALRASGGAAFSVEVDGEERLVIVQELERQHRNVDGAIVTSAIRQAVSEQHELQAYGVVLLKPGGIPKTSSGKIQRHACRAGFLAGSLEVISSDLLVPVGASAPVMEIDPDLLKASTGPEQRTMLERYLLELIARAGGGNSAQIKPEQPVSKLGLDSLMAVELQHAIETQLGLMLPMVSFLQDRSISQLVAELQGQLRNGPAIATLAPVNHSDMHHPLSDGQRALWFLHQLAPDSAAYNLVNAVCIRGMLDVAALQQTFQQLVDRHPALRTTFDIVAGELVQQVQAQRPVAFEVEAADQWSEATLQQRLQEEAQRPFELGRGPLLRVLLLTRGPQEHILLVALHHIVADLWSLALLTSELGSLYPATVAGTIATLPPLPLHYSDYVRWSVQLLAGDMGQELWHYWRTQLAGAPTVLDLPTDRPRPPIQSYQGALHSFSINLDVTQQVKHVAESHDTTLYTTLLAAFEILLARYSSQEDFLIGTPTTGRTRAELAGIVGYFVNSVVLRADLRGAPSFSTVLERTRQTVLAAWEHQDYPFVTLVERLQPERDLSRSPLFQVMFALQKAHVLDEAGLTSFALGEPGAQMMVGGLQFEAIALDQRVAQFDLTLTVGEVANGLAATLEYNSDLFDADSIKRMAGHFTTLLSALVADPSQPMGRVALLSPVEQQQLLVEWNRVAVPYPREACVHELFEAEAARLGNNVAIVCGTEQVSYESLNQRANRLAHHLRELGVGPEVIVGICTERVPAMMVGILAVLKAGGAYLPLDPAYPRERLHFMLTDTGVTLVLTQQHLLPDVSVAGVQVRAIEELEASLAESDQHNPARGSHPENPVCVIYTSGSTGVPKGVVLTHHGIVNLVTSFRHSYQPTPADRILPLTALASASFVGEIFPLLCSGGTLVLPNELALLDFSLLFTLIAQQRVTMLSTVPALMARLNERVAALPDLRLILSGGEALVLSDIDHLIHAAVIANGYGLTETTVCSTMYQLDGAQLVTTRDIPIGKPVINSAVYVLDQQLAPVPIGCPGELYIAGVGLARGYLHNPALTALRFVPNPFVAGTRMYRTGDRARWLADGNLHYLGRVDQQIKLRGFRIEPGEIEARLGQHPHVREAVVVAREDTPGDKRLVAYVVTDDEQFPPGELRHFVQDQLPEYMVPAAWVFLPTLPLTTNGKVDLAALPIPELARPELTTAYAGPRSELEQRIVQVWQAALKLEQVGMHDNFFELGGHSLLLVQVHTALQSSFPQLSLIDMFKYPTISTLATYLDHAQPVQPSGQALQERAQKQRDARTRRQQLMKDRTR